MRSTSLTVAAFVAGLAAGLFLRRAPEAPVRPTAAVERRIAEAPASVSEASESQRERIRELEARVVELERASPAPAPKADRRVVAQEVWEEFLRLSRGGSDSESVLKAFSRLGELDADSTAYFVEKFRSRKADSPYDANMPLVLALASGGPDAAALILGLLKDPATPDLERRHLLGNVAGENGFYSMNRIPVGPELAQVAQQLASSADALERRGGAGLLGGANSGTARLLLQQLALADPDLDVRAAALRALGYGGDRASLQMLEGYTPAQEGGNAGQVERLRQAFEAARERLKKRFGG